MLLANNINPSMYVNSNIQSMKTNANYSNLTNENGDVRINFGQTKVSNVSKSKQEELNNLLKEGKKVPKFNNEEEALNYINKTKKDIINNINNSNTSTSNLFYTGNAQTTSDLGGIF